MGKIPKLAGSEFEKERRGDQAFFSVTVIRDSLTDWIIFSFIFLIKKIRAIIFARNSMAKFYKSLSASIQLLQGDS